MSDETPLEKRCTKCGEIRSVEDFYKTKKLKSGYESECKACRSQRDKLRYAANAEAICKQQREYRAANIEMLREREAEPRRLYMREYRRNNADKINEQRRVLREANPDKYRQQARLWRLANADHLREWRKKYTTAYRAANPEKFLEYGRRYRETHLEYIRDYMRIYYFKHPDAIRLKHARRRACMSGNGGIFTAQELRVMRISQAGICAYCKGQHDHQALTIDHVIPVKQGGRHEVANIVLACDRCNKSKGNRTPEQWVNRWYLRKNIGD
jgi:5-methylcytosine-specific restriction endonuclease McrA